MLTLPRIRHFIVAPTCNKKVKLSSKTSNNKQQRTHTAEQHTSHCTDVRTYVQHPWLASFVTPTTPLTVRRAPKRESPNGNEINSGSISQGQYRQWCYIGRSTPCIVRERNNISASLKTHTKPREREGGAGRDAVDPIYYIRPKGQYIGFCPRFLGDCRFRSPEFICCGFLFARGLRRCTHLTHMEAWRGTLAASTTYCREAESLVLCSACSFVDLCKDC